MGAGLDNNRLMSNSEGDPAVDGFAGAQLLFGAVGRQDILRYLMHVGKAVTFSEIAEHTQQLGVTVARHIAILEELDVVQVDPPPGERKGRRVNITLKLDRYRTLLDAWITGMEL